MRGLPKVVEAAILWEASMSGRQWRILQRGELGMGGGSLWSLVGPRAISALRLHLCVLENDVAQVVGEAFLRVETPA